MPRAQTPPPKWSFKLRKLMQSSENRAASLPWALGVCRNSSWTTIGQSLCQGYRSSSTRTSANESTQPLLSQKTSPDCSSTGSMSQRVVSFLLITNFHSSPGSRFPRIVSDPPSDPTSRMILPCSMLLLWLSLPCPDLPPNASSPFPPAAIHFRQMSPY